MRVGGLVCCAILAAGTSGCTLLSDSLCAAHCASQSHNSSSLVSFLYPHGGQPPQADSTPELHLPLRVGLAFLPSNSAVSPLDAAHQQQLLERIRQRFKQRDFVREIVLIPDYYLRGSRGFEGLQGIQRLYNIDLMALVSYDQVTHEDPNKWSLGYLTIIGAYVLKGNSHDISTLVDLAVVDPATRSLVIRAGGVDTRQGSSTLIDEARDSREAATAAFSAATDQVITNFDSALTQFESDVRAGRANVRVVHKDGGQRGGTAGGGGGGGGALGWPWIALLLPLAARRMLASTRMDRAASSP